MMSDAIIISLSSRWRTVYRTPYVSLEGHGSWLLVVLSSGDYLQDVSSKMHHIHDGAKFVYI